MKKIFRTLVAGVLEWQVRRLQKAHEYKTIVVVGSIGKTSTKLAIAHSLEKIANVVFQDGNYNDRITVPLVLFGQETPRNVLNMLAWVKLFWKNEQTIRGSYLFQYAVLELGTDGPGQINEFSYLRADVAVVTGIAPEHMEQFKTIEAVATEELSVAQFANQILINRDLCNVTLIPEAVAKRALFYGTSKDDDVRASLFGTRTTLYVQNQLVYSHKNELLPLQRRYSLAAALGVLGFAEVTRPDAIASIMDELMARDTPGRLQMLSGIKDSTIIDDTYNSSPDAVRMALELLKSLKASKKIAVLGSMNELGDVSEASHREIGKLCNPAEVDLLVTIGKEAKYIADEAKKLGCETKEFMNPYAAGLYLREQIEGKTVLLAKGSQNGVFAEEAIKPLLKNVHDQKKLVRQSDTWLTEKRKQFESLTQ